MLSKQVIYYNRDSIISQLLLKLQIHTIISKNLINQKYKEGFSLAALPIDYRRYLSANNFASEVFRFQINNKFYKNTGKPVIIIVNSYGTLLTLTNLLKNEKDKEFMKKIKNLLQ